MKLCPQLEKRLAEASSEVATWSEWERNAIKRVLNEVDDVPTVKNSRHDNNNDEKHFL